MSVDKTPADSQEQKQPTLDEQINKALANVDDKGKVIFDKDVDPLFKRAVISEKKARDHQASFTKARQEIAGLTATTEVLKQQATSQSATLTAEQVAELDDLKVTDPDAWYVLKSKYETEAMKQIQGKLDELVETASTKALQDLTATEQQETLESFNARHGLEITEDTLINDIPPRLQNKVKDMPFEEYLSEVATYLGKGKVVKQTDKELETTDLGELNGSAPTSGKSSASYQIL